MTMLKYVLLTTRPSFIKFSVHVAQCFF